MKQLAIDTHAHIYDGYDLEDFVGWALRNGEAAAALEDDFYLLLCQGRKQSPAFAGIVEMLSASSLLRVESRAGIISVSKNGENGRLYLVPGRQFVSSEGIEILAHCYSGKELDGASAETIITEISDSGIKPVLPWSPGKWLGSRGTQVKRIAENWRDKIALGDIAMRCGSEPALFGWARSHDIPIMAGSDSLPLKGEERLSCQYLSLFSVADNFEPGIESIKQVLNNGSPRAAGRRNTIPRAFSRWLRLAMKARLPNLS